MGRRGERLDGWSNVTSGLGDALRDKRLSAVPVGDFLRQQQAELLWRSDDMAARAIEKIPQDAMRRGFEFVVKPNAGEEKERATGEEMEQAIDGRTPTEWANELPGPIAEARPLGPGAMPPPSRNDWARELTRKLVLTGRATFDSTGRLVTTKATDKWLAKQLLRALRRDGAEMVTDPTLATAGAGDADDAKEQQELVKARLKALGAAHAVTEAAKFERAYGGSAIFLGTVDRSPGKAQSMLARPLDLNYLEELRFLTVLTPMELVPYRYYGDPLAPKYGKVQVWSMVPKSKGINPRPSILRVHESRLITFDGIRTSRFMVEMHRGFGDSILNRIVQHVRNFSVAYDSASALIGDFAQAIFKMKGLVELLQSDEGGLIAKRAKAMDAVRSVLRAVVIDADMEEFERKATPVTGLPELLDRMANRLAAATGMPVTMLMGEAPAGLNATGQTNRDWYNENVETLRQERLIPALERITDVELHATNGATKGKVPDGWSIQMGALDEPNEAEDSKNRLQDAQAVAALIAAGVLHPEEVAQSMYGGDRYSRDIKLDADVRGAAKDMLDEQADNEAADKAQQLEMMKQGMQAGLPAGQPKPPKPGKPKPFPKK
jgi:phage-related protein (TIGR01555 family)